MFRKNKIPKKEKPKPSIIRFEGKKLIVFNFWYELEKRNELIDSYMVKGYKLISIAGMDGYLVTMEKPDVQTK